MPVSGFDSEAAEPGNRHYLQIVLKRYSVTISALLALFLLAMLAAAVAAPASGQPLRRAGLVVQLGDSETITRCVSFSEGQISGAALLERSGLELATVSDPGLGMFVCGIAGVGCSANDCLCAYPPVYWQYWLRQDGGWRFSPVGASGRVVSDGSVDGWVWGGVTTAPPDLAFSEICSTAVEYWLPLVVR